MSNIDTIESELQLEYLAFIHSCGSLSAEEQDQVAQELIDLPEFQTRVAYWNQYITELDLSLEAVSAPTLVWQNVRQEIAQSTIISDNVQEMSSNSLADHLTKGLKKWWLGLKSVSWGLAASAMLILLVVFVTQPKSPVNIDNQWIVKSNVNSNVITLVAVSPAPIPVGITCNLWITNDEGALFVASLPEKGKVSIDLSNYPDVLEKFDQPGLLQVTFDPKGSQPQTMGKVMFETSWSI